MHTFKAKVVKGKGRGKKIGFPTINLNPVNLSIDYGVYLVEAQVGSKMYKGLLHFGPKKTFNEGVSTEVYLENFSLNVYPKNVIIKIVKKLRNVKKFKSVRELKEQISKDIKSFRK